MTEVGYVWGSFVVHEVVHAVGELSSENTFIGLDWDFALSGAILAI